MASKILIIVEGSRTDVRLIERLLRIYGIDRKHEVVSYNTNIYVLYQEMFADGDPSSIDLIQLLKEKESDPVKKEIFNNRFSDILLIFDLEPQDERFTPDKIQEMMEYFVESSDMGKLYLNYPMVEAFYHMKTIPDEDYYSYNVSLNELKQGKYKERVHRENRNHDYSKFAINQEECNMVINQNIKKAWKICGGNNANSVNTPPESIDILNSQLKKIERENSISVLCTSAFYIVDYNPNFIRD